LGGSVAGLLKESRNQVKEQLQGQSVVDTRKTLDDSRKPIEEIGASVEDSLGKIFIDNKDMVETGLDKGSMVAIIISATVAIPALLLLCTTTCGVFCSKRETFRDPNVRPQNACHASSSWCITCLWTFLVLLITSVVLFVGFIGASACVVLQDVDVYVNDLVAKTNTDQKTKDQMTAIVTNCFADGGSGEFTNEIEIEVSPTETKTLKEALNVGGLINAPFDALDKVLNDPSNSFNLANEPNIVAFLRALEDWGTVFSPQASLLVNQGVDVSVEPALTFAKGQAACADRIVNLADYTENMKQALGLSGQSGTMTVFGQEKFNTKVIAAGSTLTANSVQCVRRSDLAAGGSGNELKFRNLASAAITVRDDTSFTCHTVSFTLGSDGYMTANPVVSGSCGGTGTLNKYENHIVDMKNKLMQQIGAIDVASDNTKLTISSQMRNLVKTTFSDKIDSIVTRINCQFLGIRWNEMTDAICLAMVPGMMATAFSWLAMAVIAWAAIFIEFNIWRRLKDNRGLWQDEVNRQRQ